MEGPVSKGKMRKTAGPAGPSVTVVPSGYDTADVHLDQLNRQIVACTRCDRLVRHCRAVAAQKRAAYRAQTYWGRPVPNLLPARRAADARLLVVGLAPGAHGANRTGRMFTGDKSGDFLYRALHEAGFASQPTSTGLDDGLQMRGAVITAAGHCAPPGNKPTPAELANCAAYLAATIDAMPALRVVLTLGKIAHDAVLREYRARGWIASLSAAPFAHGAVHFEAEASRSRPSAVSPGPPVTLCSYHPSQQNTFTGRLTAAMLLDVLRAARAWTAT